MSSFLAADLADFRSANPMITLDVSTEHHFVDLEQEMVDIAIRLARPIKGESRMSKLGGVEYKVYQSCMSPVDMTGVLPLLNMSIHFKHQGHEIDVGSAEWMISHLPPGRVVSCTDSFLTLQAMCEGGMGLALLPDILGDGNPRLEHVFAEYSVIGDVWLVLHGDTRHRARVRIFIDFMKTAFRRRVSALKAASA